MVDRFWTFLINSMFDDGHLFWILMIALIILALWSAQPPTGKIK